MAESALIAGIPQIITAIGGLGTAAFGLVETTKALWGGVNHFGFGRIEGAVRNLAPPAAKDGTGAALSQDKVVATLKANWFNGTDLPSQKAIAKSLIKLNFNESTAPALAVATGVAADKLTAIASSVASGTALTPDQSDLFGRFDLIVTALLDEAYQRADQVFKNGTKFMAMIFALVLAIAGACVLAGTTDISGHQFATAIVVGLLATPLAPIAKDLSTALATAVNTMQLFRK